jgi:hypothetical protein
VKSYWDLNLNFAASSAYIPTQYARTGLVAALSSKVSAPAVSAFLVSLHLKNRELANASEVSNVTAIP